MVDLSVVLTFISPIIVIACLCVGFVIKNAIPNETVNRFIPIIVMILGIILNIWTAGLVTLETCVAGAVSGLASTGLYEAFKQILGLGKTSEEVEEESKQAPQHIAK